MAFQSPLYLAVPSSLALYRPFVALNYREIWAPFFGALNGLLAYSFMYALTVPLDSSRGQSLIAKKKTKT
jgi:hypothetical protein